METSLMSEFVSFADVSLTLLLLGLLSPIAQEGKNL